MLCGDTQTHTHTIASAPWNSTEETLVIVNKEQSEKQRLPEN